MSEGWIIFGLVRAAPKKAIARSEMGEFEAVEPGANDRVGAAFLPDPGVDGVLLAGDVAKAVSDGEVLDGSGTVHATFGGIG